MMKKIGIMGSAFNPPTLGHLDLINQALAEMNEVWLVPSFNHAFGKKMISYKVRCMLLESFVRDIGVSNLMAQCIEHLIPKLGPVYTWDVMSFFERIKPEDSKLVFVMGPDNSENWSKFYRYQDIDEKWGHWSGIARTEIRSTLVRQKILNQEDISEYVTPSVNSIIKERAGNLFLNYI